MVRFLIDENLSPAIAFYLRKQGYQAKAVRELGLVGEPDEAIINFATKHNWVIITGDIEFGQFFYEKLGKISMIVVRSPLHNTSAILKILQLLDKNGILKQIPSKYHLVLASPVAIRIRKYEN